MVVDVVFLLGEEMKVYLDDIGGDIRSLECGFHLRVEDGIEGDVVLNEAMLDLPEGLLLLQEAFRMQVFEYLVGGHEEVDEGDDEAYHRAPRP